MRIKLENVKSRKFTPAHAKTQKHKDRTKYNRKRNISLYLLEHH